MASTLDDVPARALAVYAHPDDPEVSCGGTLARWAAAGAEVHVVVATLGDKGSHDPATDPKKLSSQRAAEARAAAGILGATAVELLGRPDGELDADLLALRAELVGIVRRLRPEIVVCPDPTAVFFGDAYVNHVDHRTIGWATLDAVAPAAAQPLYFPDLGEPHQVATVLLSGTLEADAWVDVAGSVDAKVAALRCHRSQVGDEDDDWLVELVRSRAQEEGRRAGLELAEGFRRIRFSR